MQALRFQMWGFPVWQRPRLHSISNQDFDRRRLGQAVDMSLQRRAGSFFESLDGPLVLSRMSGAAH